MPSTYYDAWSLRHAMKVRFSSEQIVKTILKHSSKRAEYLIPALLKNAVVESKCRDWGLKLFSALCPSADQFLQDWPVCSRCTTGDEVLQDGILFSDTLLVTFCYNLVRAMVLLSCNHCLNWNLHTSPCWEQATGTERYFWIISGFSTEQKWKNIFLRSGDARSGVKTALEFRSATWIKLFIQVNLYVQLACLSYSSEQVPDYWKQVT